jgi:hypothetical protein
VSTVYRPVRLFALALCLVVAGCAGVGVPADTGTTTAPTTTGTTTTAPTTTGTTACTVDVPAERGVPDLPETLTRERAAAFVAAYEEAAVWNRLVGDGKGSLGVHVDRTTVLNQTADGYVVRAEGGFGFADCLDGRRVEGDGVVNATYFLNESALVSLPGGNGTGAPGERGTVVERQT